MVEFKEAFIASSSDYTLAIILPKMLFAFLIVGVFMCSILIILMYIIERKKEARKGGWLYLIPVPLAMIASIFLTPKGLFCFVVPLFPLLAQPIHRLRYYLFFRE